MRILITGATGFVGKALIPQLYHNENFEICLLNECNLKSVAYYKNYKNVRHIDLESDSYKNKIKLFNPKIVIHLASYLTSKDDEKTINKILDANIVFGTHLLDALVGTNIEYFINTGTSTEYFHNNKVLKSAYFYSATKTAFRSILEYYKNKIGFSIINIIPYTLYGKNDTQKKVIDYILSSLNNNESIKMTKGEQKLDFIYITDLIDFYLILLSNLEKIKKSYSEFNIGTGKGTSIKNLAKIIERISGQKTNISWGALKYRKMGIMKSIAKIDESKKLGWNPKISIEKGIELIIGEEN